jgi:acyl-[acyl carrier protein]--UDP-N-acetylglucosamine O-acyltransferase
MYMMVFGDCAELRGLNLEGLWWCGFSDPEVSL